MFIDISKLPDHLRPGYNPKNPPRYTTSPYIDPRLISAIQSVAATCHKDTDRQTLEITLNEAVFDQRLPQIKAQYRGFKAKQLYWRRRERGPELLAQLRASLASPLETTTRHNRSAIIRRAIEAKRQDAIAQVKGMCVAIGRDYNSLAGL